MIFKDNTFNGKQAADKVSFLKVRIFRIPRPKGSTSSYPHQ